jgi:hypothetical protein
MASAESPSPSPSPPRSELHNASFSLSRITPLYSFNSSHLRRYAHEFRDIVRGDVIRGVNINTGGLERAKASLLHSCEWTLENGLLPTVEFQSVVIKISWDDGSTYTAILLPDFTSSQTTLGKRKRGPSSNDTEFTSMPLLLTRGFPPVTQQLLTYLTTRFDSRVSDVHLPPTLLGECLQGYLGLLFKESPVQRVINSRLKILELTFSTPEPTTPKVKGALRKIVFSIDGADVQELCGR